MSRGAPWHLVKARLADVLAAPEAERGAILLGLEPAVRAAVEELAGAYATADDFLGSPPVASGEAIRTLAREMDSNP